MLRHRLFLLMLTVFFCCKSFSQDRFSKQVLEIRSIKAASKITPGQYVTIFIEIENTSDLEQKGLLQIELPEQWKRVIFNPNIKLKAKAKKTILVTVSPSKQASSGKQKLCIKLNAIDEKINPIIHELIIEIEAKVLISISILNKPDYLFPKDTLKVSYLFSNDGNINDTLNIKSFINKEAPTISNLVLLPGETKPFAIKHDLSKLKNLRTVFLSLNAISTMTDSILNSVEIINIYQTETKKERPYYFFPITIEGSYFSRTSDIEVTGFRYSIKGDSYLDPLNKKHLLNFIFQNSSQNDQQLAGNNERYFASYTYKGNKLEIGHNTFSLSDLSTNLHFGIGIGYTREFEKFTLSAFLNKPLFLDRVTKQTGIKAFFKYNKKIEASIDFLSENISQDSIKIKNYVFSTKMDYKGEKIDLDFTAALSKQTLDDTPLDFAMALNFNTNFERYNASAAVVLAGQDFTGAFSNTKSFSGIFTARLTRKINLSLNYQFQTLNKKLDQQFQAIFPESNAISLSLSYRITDKHQVSILATNRTREDKNVEKTFDFKENLFGLRYKYKGKKIDIESTVNFGKSENFLLANQNNNTSEVLEITLQGTVNLGAHFNANLFSSLTKTNRFSTTDLVTQEFNILGGGLNYRNKKLGVNIRFRNRFLKDDAFKPQSFLDGGLTYNLNRNHSLSLSASINAFPGNELKKTTNFLISYRLNLNVPIAKNKTLGHISGSLINKGVEKISNILISLNDQITITDQDGKFEFNNLPLGSYFLRVNRGELNIGEDMESENPIPIQVNSNEITEIEVSMIKTGSIKGVITFNNKDLQGSTQITKLTNRVIIILEKDKKQLLSISNEKGSFNFSELRPGTYTISISKKGLNKNQKINNKKWLKKKKQKSRKKVKNL